MLSRNTLFKQPELAAIKEEIDTLQEIKTAPIEVRHIAVIQQNNQRHIEGYEPRGEYEPFSVTPPLPTERLEGESKITLMKRFYSYIRQLAEKAAETHLNNHFTQHPEKIDAGKENHITRLVMHEFSLYPHPSQGPFEVAEFNHIVSFVTDLANQLPTNLQLLLGTLPVNHQGTVKNVALFVECGAAPRVQAFAKTFPYIDHEHHHFDPYCEPSTNKAPLQGEDKEALPYIEIKNGGNFHYRTEGGALGHLVVDICEDFYNHVGVTNASQDVIQHIQKASDFFPTHAEHLIISNVLDRAFGELVSESVFMADPHHTNNRANYKNIPDEPQHRYMRRHTLEKTEEIESPAFGSQLSFDVYAPEQIKKHKGHFNKDIRNYNRTLADLLALHQYKESLEMKDGSEQTVRAIDDCVRYLQQRMLHGEEETEAKTNRKRKQPMVHHHETSEIVIEEVNKAVKLTRDKASSLTSDQLDIDVSAPEFIRQSSLDSTVENSESDENKIISASSRDETSPTNERTDSDLSMPELIPPSTTDSIVSHSDSDESKHTMTPPSTPEFTDIKKLPGSDEPYAPIPPLPRSAYVDADYHSSYSSGGSVSRHVFFSKRMLGLPRDDLDQNELPGNEPEPPETPRSPK